MASTLVEHLLKFFCAGSVARIGLGCHDENWMLRLQSKRPQKVGKDILPCLLAAL